MVRAAPNLVLAGFKWPVQCVICALMRGLGHEHLAMGLGLCPTAR